MILLAGPPGSKGNAFTITIVVIIFVVVATIIALSILRGRK